jgi:hypothetical protein
MKLKISVGSVTIKVVGQFCSKNCPYICSRDDGKYCCRLFLKKCGSVKELVKVGRKNLRCPNCINKKEVLP